MHAEEHSTVREGLVVGLIGAVVVAAWYFVFDAAAGRPFHTPNVLGRIFFQGDVNPGPRAISPGVVAGYTVIHVAVFALAGMGLTLLAHLASANLGLRMGVWIGLVVSFCFLTGLTYMLAIASGERLPLWEVIGGGLLGVGGMAWILWRRHPRLASSFQEDRPGNRAETPPHAPGGPRV